MLFFIKSKVKSKRNGENVPNFSTAASSMPLKTASAKGGLRSMLGSFCGMGGGGGVRGGGVDR
jgi:hypothetical protein